MSKLLMKCNALPWQQVLVFVLGVATFDWVPLVAQDAFIELAMPLAHSHHHCYVVSGKPVLVLDGLHIAKSLVQVYVEIEEIVGVEPSSLKEELNKLLEIEMAVAELQARTLVSALANTELIVEVIVKGSAQSQMGKKKQY